MGLLISVANLNTVNLHLGSSVVDENNNSKIKIEKTLTTEEYVRKYFSDEPILAEIARCESQFRQEDKNGEVLRGKENSFDRGVMQINEMYHAEKAEKLGFDLMTIEGNASYARYLFEREGVRPWASSSKCWKKSQAYADYERGLALALK